MKRRILFLVPADYAALQHKGVAPGILDRDEHGFFDRVLTVHPIARQGQCLELSPVHQVIEFDLGRALDPGAGWLVRLGAPLRAVALVPYLARLIRKERVDIVRANDPYLMGILAWAAARLTGRPFCVSIHADYEKSFHLTPTRGLRRWLRLLSRWCPRFVFKRADLILPIRRHLARWAERHGASPDRMCIIPHGVDFSRFATTLAQGGVFAAGEIPASARIVSFVGRLSRENYVDDVLDVAERVLSTRDDVFFVLMGSGEEHAWLVERIHASPSLRNGVRLLGSRPFEDVIRLRRASDVSLCPMGGFSLLEACAVASAVVTYDVDWHSEVITHEVTGLMVPEGDVAALAASVLRLLDDLEFRQRLGANARAFIEEHHDERRTSAIKRECYQRLLAAREAA